MRKVSLLIVAFLFTAGMAFAQNTTDIDQDGTGLTATVDQSGTDNDAVAFQRGSFNKEITITQVGTDNWARSSQTNTGNYTELTRAVQDQTGNDNEAEIIQTGRSVTASQTQYGNDNWAFINQASYVDAQQDQGDEGNQGQYGNDNHAEIEHQGQNFANIRSQATQLQVGDDNYAWMWQQGQQNNSATHQQFGDWNEISTKQNGRHNTIHITQNDDNNIVAGVTMSSSLAFNAGGYGLQEGDDNSITILQDGEVGGDANEIGFYQTDGAWADIHQFGEGNLTLIHQEGGVATVLQGGSNNVANVTQGTGL